MLRITIFAALIIILTMRVASAQPNIEGLPGYSNAARDNKERKNDRDIDRDYKSTIRRLPDKEKKNSDPWGDVRPTPPAAAKNKQ